MRIILSLPKATWTRFSVDVDTDEDLYEFFIDVWPQSA